jgi:hypothetical protein
LVTFAIHAGNNTDASISLDEVDQMFNDILKIDKKVGEIKMRQNFLIKKYEGHFKCIIFNLATQRSNKHIVASSIWESFAMVGIFVAQFFYLKFLMNKNG